MGIVAALDALEAGEVCTVEIGKVVGIADVTLEREGEGES